VFFFIYSLVFIISVVMELCMIGILNDHSFHDLQTSLHWSTIKWIFFDLSLLLVWFLFFMAFVLLLFSLLLFKPFHVFLHVFVKYLPLGSFNWKLRALWRVSFNSPLFQNMIESLAPSLLVIKSVPQRGVLLVYLIFCFESILFILILLNAFVHFHQKLLIFVLFHVPILYLIWVFIWVFFNDVAVNVEVAHHLLNKLINLELLLFVRVLSQICWCLRILNIKTLRDHSVFLLLGQLNLVCLILIRIHKVLSSNLWFVFFFFLNNLCLLLLLSYFLN